MQVFSTEVFVEDFKTAFTFEIDNHGRYSTELFFCKVSSRMID